MPLSLSPFAPGRLLGNPHLQTAFAGVPTRPSPQPGVETEELRVELPLGEALHARAHWQATGARRPTALLVHGVGGSIDSAYVVRAARAMAGAGYHAVCLNLRGAGQGAALSRSLYHAGLTSDIERVIDRLGDDPRVGPLVLVGFSLGGQMALLLAAERGENLRGPLRQVVAVSPPLDLAEAARLIERWPAYPYKRYILGGLIEQAVSLARRAPGRLGLDEAQIRQLPEIRAYDEHIIAPMHGFSSARSYYRTSSCGPRLSEIRLPTLVLAAEDDPIVPAHTLRPALARASSSVQMVWTERGGHLGFVEKVSDGLGRSWLNGRLLEVMAAQASP